MKFESITLTLFLLLSQSAWPQSQSRHCRYGTPEDLVRQVDQEISQFKKLTERKFITFSVGYSDLQMVKENSEKLSEMEKFYSIQRTEAALLLYERDQVLENPTLHLFKTNGLMRIDFLPERWDRLCLGACTDLFWYRYGFNLQFVKKLVTLYGNKYRKIIRFVLAHEISHVIVNLNRWDPSKYANTSASEFEKIQIPHVLVDAVAANLIGISLKDAADALRDVNDTIFERQEGTDAGSRIECLSN